MPRVAVKPEILDWAVARSGKDRANLVKRFVKLEEWESGEIDPTLKQLEDFARATYPPWASCSWKNRLKTSCRFGISAR